MKSGSRKHAAAAAPALALCVYFLGNALQWFALAFWLCSWSVAAQATVPPVQQDPQDEAVSAPISDRLKAALASVFRGKAAVEAFRKTPVAGWYEARMGKSIFYVEESGRYAFVQGDLVDLVGRKNLTQERLQDLLKVNFNELPLHLAIKQVFGKGERKLAIFEDVNCSSCKKMRAELVTLDNLTVYIFPLAFLRPDSALKANQVLCSKDPAAAWDALMLKKKSPNNKGDCNTSLQQIIDYSHTIGVEATPTMFLEDGRRLVGYVSSGTLVKEMQKSASVAQAPALPEGVKGEEAVSKSEASKPTKPEGSKASS